MSIPFLIFFVCAFLAVLGAALLIFSREPIHSALSLILVMMALAVLYLLLGAEFIAAVQIIVYAGAIMVLFVFVIMLLNAGFEERTDWSKIAKFVGVPLGFFLLLETAHWLAHSDIGSGGCQWRRSPIQRWRFYARSFHRAFPAISISL